MCSSSTVSRIKKREADKDRKYICNLNAQSPKLNQGLLLNLLKVRLNFLAAANLLAVVHARHTKVKIKACFNIPSSDTH